MSTATALAWGGFWHRHIVPGYCCFARKNWRVPGGLKGAGGRIRKAFVMLTTVPGVQVEGGGRSGVEVPVEVEQAPAPPLATRRLP